MARHVAPRRHRRLAACPLPGPIDVAYGAALGVLGDDLAQACERAIARSRTRCRGYARTLSWSALADQFLATLAPLPGRGRGACRPARARPSWRAMGATGWQHFEHGSDVGVRGFGPTRAAAFAEAARALTAAVADLDSVRAKTPVEIACEAPSDERLLVAWLDEVVFAMATRGMLFARFEVAIDGGRLAATAWGEPVDVARHQPAAEVKGATHTALSVRRDAGGGWIAECVLDV